MLISFKKGRCIIAGLMESSFIKNVFVVMTGTAVAQIIGFALSPIISRLFTPSDFGVFGSFNAVAAIISAGATLQYSQAIMLPKDKEDAINLFFVACLCTFLVSFLCFVVCLVNPAALNGLMKTDGVWALSLLIVSTIVAGLNQSCQAWSVRVKSFKQTSTSQVIRSLSSSGTKLVFGYFKGGAVSLIISDVFADILATINLARVVFHDIKVLRRDIRCDRMKHLAKEYMDFLIYSFPMNVINSLSQGLPVFLLAHFYGIAVAGAYAFGMRILQTPMGLVLNALRQVLFQKACETKNLGGRLLPLYMKTTVGLFALAFLPSMILFMWAPQFFTWIFGPQWHTAGEFVRYQVLWMMLMFCNLPSVLFSQVISLQRQMFLFDLALLSARALVLIIGGMYMTAIYTIMLFSLLGAVMNIIYICIVGYFLMSKERDASFKGI